MKRLSFYTLALLPAGLTEHNRLFIRSFFWLFFFLKAAAELSAEEHQRVLGIFPNFSTSNIDNAEPLNPQEKSDLAAKSAFDPFTFIVAGVDAGISQGGNDFLEIGKAPSGTPSVSAPLTRIRSTAS